MIYNLHPELAPFVGRYYAKTSLKVFFAKYYSNKNKTIKAIIKR